MSKLPANTRVRAFAAAITLVALSACGEGVTAPDCDRCDELRVVTDNPEYPNKSIVRFTITNRTTAAVRYDWCSVQLSSRTSNAPFEVRYLPARRCGFGAGPEQVIANMRTLAAGASDRDSVAVGGAALQGQYRIQIWLLDETGLPEQGNPVVSNIFDVWPGADRRIR